MNTKKAKLGIFFIPIIVIVLIIISKIAIGPAFVGYIFLISEDGPVEYATFIIYFVTFIISLISAKIFFKRGKKSYGFLYVAMALVFIFIAIEEISWGQRILSLDLPEFFAESNQEEMNIHDLPAVATFEDPMIIMAGLIGGLLWIVFHKSKSSNFFNFKRFFVPGWYLMSYFIPVSIFYLMLNLTPPEQISQEGFYWNFTFPKEQEPFEFLLSLGFFGFILLNYIRLRNAKGK